MTRCRSGSIRPIRSTTPNPLRTFTESSQVGFDLVGKLNRLRAVEYPDDPALAARIKSYELASACSVRAEVLGLGGETEETRRLYGLDQPQTRTSARSCWRRGARGRGVRFIQIQHGAGGAGPGTRTAI